MGRVRSYLLVAVALLIAGAAFTIVTSGPALAQVRAALVRDVDSPARQPVVLLGQAIASHYSGYSPFCPVEYDVPANKRFVVEYIAGRAQDSARPQLTQAELWRGTDTLLGQLPFAPIETKPEFMTLAQPLTMYFEAGDHVRLCMVRYHMTDTSGGASVQVVGHLIDVN